MLAGRDRGRLERLSAEVGNAPIRVASLSRPRTLGPLLDGVRVVINCAGPFMLLGEPMVNAAVESGVHYLDITGEQPFMKRILNRYDGVALRRGVTVINAMAFEYAVGDWLAAHAARRLGNGEPIDSISLGYQLRVGGISRGTAQSIFEALGSAGWSYEGGRWRTRSAGWTSRRMRFPSGTHRVSWMPFGETLTVPRHVRLSSVLTYARLPRAIARLVPLVAGAMPRLYGLGRPLVRRLVNRRSFGPGPAARARSNYVISLEGWKGGDALRLAASGHDPYGVTAAAATLAAETLLTEQVQRGVRAPAHLPIDPGDALNRLGVTVAPIDGRGLAP